MVPVNKCSIATSKDVLIADGLEEDWMVRKVHCAWVQGDQTACLHLKSSFQTQVKKCQSNMYLPIFNKYPFTSPTDRTWTRFQIES